ncbi:hypothetical protein V8C35DRAFT_318785 [Trichoderma chlorosporum]
MDDHLNFDDGSDLPPPYSPSAGQASSAPVQRSDSLPALSIFSSHVAGLRNEITASQAARASARDDRDSRVLSLIVPYVEDFLASISEIHPTPRLAEATFVPDAAISAGWKFSDEEEKRAGEFRKLIRVRDDTKKNGGLKKKEADGYVPSSRSEKGGDDETSPSLWWENESMARRLAKHLQPQRPAAPINPQVCRGRNISQTKKSGIWGIFKKSDEPARSRAPVAEEPRDGVVMTAKAEEVTFRKENEFGLWETLTGFGIVVRVRIKMAGDVRSA